MPLVILSPVEEDENLTALVAMLNDDRKPPEDWIGFGGKGYDSKDAARLRRLVLAWKAMMEEGGRQDLSCMTLSPEDRNSLNRFMKGIQTYFNFDGSLAVTDAFPHPYDEAAIQFTRLLRNSQRWRLAKCVGCSKWFRKDDPRRTFCSKQCGGGARQARRRKLARDKKIKKIKQYLRNYANRPPRHRAVSWKDWVVQASAGAISKRFLTSAVWQGELTEPKG